MLEKFVQSQKRVMIDSDDEIIKKVKEMINQSDSSIVEMRHSLLINDHFQESRQIFATLIKNVKYKELIAEVGRYNEFQLRELISTNCNETLSYETYCNLRHKASETNGLYENILTAELFCTLPQAATDFSTKQKKSPRYIYRSDLVNAAVHAIHARQFRVQLDQYALVDQISEDAVGAFIQQVYSSFDNKITPETEPYYVAYVSRAISFFLDYKGSGRINLTKLCSSFYLQAALTLDPTISIGRLFGPLAQGNQTLFTHQAFVEAYSNYQQAAAYTMSAGGLLTLDDTSKLSFYPSREFASHWYFSVETYGDKIDFRQYLSYLLAVSYPCSLGAGWFVFNVMDSQQGKGYLTRSDIRRFVASVYKDMEKMYSDIGLPMDDFVDEIFDNVKPADKHNIYFSDIQKSNSSEYLVRYCAAVSSLMEKEGFAQNATPNINDIPWQGPK